MIKVDHNWVYWTTLITTTGIALTPTPLTTRMAAGTATATSIATTQKPLTTRVATATATSIKTTLSPVTAGVETGTATDIGIATTQTSVAACWSIEATALTFNTNKRQRRCVQQSCHSEMSCLLLTFQHYCMGKEIICPANFLRKTAMKEIKIADSTCRWNHLFRTRFCYKLSLQLLSVLLSVVIYFGIFEWLVWIRIIGVIQIKFNGTNNHYRCNDVLCWWLLSLR